MESKIFLITGFLGAGKTSFLQYLLEQSPFPVGVLVNEFGKKSVDGPLLQNQKDQLIELNNGSIFCSCLKDNFIQALADLIGRKLPYIYVESSGLADPSNMKAILEILEKQTEHSFGYHGSICLVDGLYFEKELAKMVSVEKQIRQARWILINKKDLISPAQQAKIKTIIETLNPTADIFYTHLGKLPVEIISSGMWQSPETRWETGEKEDTLNQKENRPYIALMHIAKTVSATALNDMIAASQAFFPRIKGIVTLQNQTYTVDSVQDSLDFKLLETKDMPEEERPDYLVFISGTGIKALTPLIEAANQYLPEQFWLD